MRAMQLDLLDWRPPAQKAPARKSATRAGPAGGAKQRAAWLRAALADGRLTRGAAEAIGLESGHLDEVMAGRSALSSTAWAKLAAVADEGPPAVLSERQERARHVAGLCAQFPPAGDPIDDLWPADPHA